MFYIRRATRATRLLASSRCSPRRRHSPSTGSRPGRCGSRSTSTAACPPSPSSAFPTPRCARRASGCGRRWPTAASSSRCGGSSPTWRPASLRKAGPGAGPGDRRRPAGRLGTARLGGGPSAPAMVGELALDGSVRPVAGVLAIAEAARELGAEAIVVPAENGPEAALVAGIEVIPIDSLDPAAGARRRRVGAAERPAPLPLALEPGGGGPDLADLRGQRHLRHALEVAAAGGHSLLMVGPPGAGKSMAASRLPSILPAPAPRGGARGGADRERLRAPRRPAARRAAVPRAAPHDQPGRPGRRRQPARPGEATLAHRGVLFLDELCEFRRDTLEALRAPLETGWVSIARPGAWQRLPCRFMLVAAANPCPCGRGEADPECSCSPLAIQRYQGRLSGALADRIDILAAIRQPERRGDRRRAGRALGGGPGAGRRRPGPPGRAPRAGALQRRDDPGRGARVRARARPPRRCSPTPTRAAGSAAAPTTGCCGWRRRSPTSPAARRSSASRWPRRCSCGGGTTSERGRGGRACPTCLRRARLLAHLAPYIEKVATGSPGSRSPELLRLSNEDLVAAVAPRAEAQAPGGGRRRPPSASLRGGAGGGGVLGLLPARPALPARACATPPTRPGR